MKNIYCLVIPIFACALFYVRPLLADSPSFAVVDMERIVKESALGKAARATLEKEAEEREVLLNATRASLAKRAEEIEKQKSVLSASAYEQKRSELDQSARDLQRKVQDQREELGRKNVAEVRRIVEKVQAVVQAFGREKGIQTVLEKNDRSILFVDSSIDITSEVIKKIGS